MKNRYLIFTGISTTIFLIGVIIYPITNEVRVEEYWHHDIPTALANTPPIHPDDIQRCLDGEFSQYDWCSHHISNLSPLKQFKSGIPINEIQCKEG